MLENLRIRKKHPIFALAFQIKHDSVAQLVEHIPFKDGVLGSNPSWITGEVFYIRRPLFYYHLVIYSTLHSYVLFSESSCVLVKYCV